MLQLKQDLKTEHTTYSYQNSSNGDFFFINSTLMNLNQNLIQILSRFKKICI